MGKFVLISCASKKSEKKSIAEELYISPLFKLNLAYAKSLNPSKIFILSAKYGLLDLNDEVVPYNETLNTMKDEEIKNWSIGVLNKLKDKVDLENDKIIFLAGERYRRHLTPSIKNYEIPMKRLGIGKQLKYLKESIKNEQRM